MIGVCALPAVAHRVRGLEPAGWGNTAATHQV